MKKIIFKRRDIELMMHDLQFSPDKCYKGCLSVGPERKEIRFEQTVAPQPAHRNPKIYAGHYVSLVHQRNGRYKMNVRSIDLSQTVSIAEVASAIASEVHEAAQMLA